MDEQYTMDEYEQWLNKLFFEFELIALKEYSYLPSLRNEKLVRKNKEKIGSIIREEDIITFTKAYKNWKKGKLTT